MTQDQTVILLILALTAAMFIWGRWRHDMVALAALLACVFAGLVPSADAFAGFGHPAVITVACVLVLSQGLQTSGAIDALAERILPASARPEGAIASIITLGAVLSAFMNNVGALALLMPAALQMAARRELPPGKVLMPLAFGSILGGMTTLIGTPPNLIVSSFRASNGGGNFAVFDFTPVGLPVAFAGIVFIASIGWRLVPERKGAGAEEFDTGAYLTEARVPEKGKAVGMSLREIEEVLDAAGAQIVGLVRSKVRVTAPNPMRRAYAGDILVIEADPKALTSALSALDLTLVEAVQDQRQTGPAEAAGGKEAAAAAKGGKEAAKETASDKTGAQSDEIIVRELAVLPGSDMAGRSAADIQLRTRFGVNLLAISRQGRRSIARLRKNPIRPGDVLLMQGGPGAISEFAVQYGCVPLAERKIRLPDKRSAFVATAIMTVAVGAAGFGVAPAAICFAAGVLASAALKIVPTRRIYESIDWSVIVLLGALIPVAGALATTGAAGLIARALLERIAQGDALITLTLILIITMALSDFMNNAATAAVMCPIALGASKSLGANADPFLMAVAVGASCAFLTPIGHQNNTLILGPGGFRFGDYWRLGLPLEIIVVAVGAPLITLAWPL
jgi:di/tricarboxylate transporter